MVTTLNQVKLNIETDLLDFWHPVVSGNIDQVIAPFRQDLTMIEVNLSRKVATEKESNSHAVLYKCEVIYKHKEKQILSNASINRDARQAVADAMSRLKRELSRAQNSH